MTYKYQLQNIFKIVPILFLLVSCGYKSKFEALQACEEWASKQEDIYLEVNDPFEGTYVSRVQAAKCIGDTKKILGLKLNYSNYGSKESPFGNSKYYNIYFRDENFKVIKRFRY